MPIAADVMRMAELDRLLDEHVLVGDVAGQVEHGDDAAEDGGEADDGQDAEPGVDVGVAMEDLTHRVDVRAASSQEPTRNGGVCRSERCPCVAARPVVRRARRPIM